MGIWEIIISVILGLQSVAFIYLYLKIKKIIDFEHLQKARLDLARKIKNPSTNVQDIFRDCETHGFSFVRVDPENVLYRSPRGN